MGRCRPILGGVQSRNRVSDDRKPAAEAVQIHYAMALKRNFGVLGAVVRARDAFSGQNVPLQRGLLRFCLISLSGALPGLATQSLNAEGVAPVDGDAAGQPVSSYLQQNASSGVRFPEKHRE